MTCRIICDFDGTVALDDVTDALLERFALPQWRDIEAEWSSGRIGSRECMLRQVDLLRATPAEIDACLDHVAIDPGFHSFAVLAHRLGCELLVVSDGLDYAIRRVLARHRLAYLPILANRLERIGEAQWRLAFPHARGDCAKGSGTCKCRIATAGERTTSTLRLLIGDGASDFCAATSVHMVFAKDKLLAHCRANNLPHVPFADFAEAGRLLGNLLSGDISTDASVFSEQDSE
jgi:2,3-diketo-5-methylthio-1-phosphopentane phosphatase